MMDKTASEHRRRDRRRPRRQADHRETGPAATSASIDPPREAGEDCLAMMTWSVLPAALQRALPDGWSVWRSAENESFFGISIHHARRREANAGARANGDVHADANTGIDADVASRDVAPPDSEDAQPNVDAEVEVNVNVNVNVNPRADASAPSPDPPHRLSAWALVVDAASPDGYSRLPILDCVNVEEALGFPKHRQPAAPNHLRPPGEPPLRFKILNSRPDRLSIDISGRAAEPICRLSYLIQPNGRPIWWADSILPRLLGLEGGQYELVDVRVYDLDGNHNHDCEDGHGRDHDGHHGRDRE